MINTVMSLSRIVSIFSNGWAIYAIVKCLLQLEWEAEHMKQFVGETNHFGMALALETRRQHVMDAFARV